MAFAKNSISPRLVPMMHYSDCLSGFTVKRALEQSRDGIAAVPDVVRFLRRLPQFSEMRPPICFFFISLKPDGSGNLKLRNKLSTADRRIRETVVVLQPENIVFPSE